MNEESLAIYEQLDDRTGVTKLREATAFFLYLQGDYERALALEEQTLATFRELKEPFRIGNALTLTSLFRVHTGRFVDARATLREAMAIWRSAGDVPNMVNTLLVASLALMREDRAEACAQLGGAIAVLREPLGDLATALEILSSADPMVDARRSLGDDAFAADVARGRQLDLEAAIRLAFADRPDSGNA